MSKLTSDTVFVRVYRLPEKLTAGYCFGGGVPITFSNFDWFEAQTGEKETLIAFIKTKQYFDKHAAFLVLADDPELTFTIGKVER
jgi:hypothetical protein